MQREHAGIVPDGYGETGERELCLVRVRQNWALILGPLLFSLTLIPLSL